MKLRKKDLLLFFNKHQNEFSKFFNTMGITDLNCLTKYTKQELNYLYQQSQYYFLLKEITTKRSWKNESRFN